MAIEVKERLDLLNEDLTKAYTMIAALTAKVSALENKMIYNYIDANMPQWAHEGVKWCLDNGIIKGNENGLGLDDKDLRYCTMLMRMSQQKA